MAYIRKRGKTWQAIVRVQGAEPVSATRATKKEAELWAQAEEAAIRSGQRGQFPAKTFAEALDKYANEESPRKRSSAGELKRIEAIKRHFPDLCAMQFTAITTAHVSAWRDARTKEVTPGSVQRDANLFRHVWSVAIKEWKWAGANPWSAMRMPGNNDPRTAVWRWQQIKAILRRLGYITGLAPQTKTAEIAYLFLLGLRTGMRQGELLKLSPSIVDLDRRVVRLDTHKTVEKAGVRFVPYSKKADRPMRILLAHGITISSKSTDTLFRKNRDNIGIKNLTFHDSRATFATLMARKVDPLTLAKILGHKDLKQLIQTYYREDPADIAARL